MFEVFIAIVKICCFLEKRGVPGVWDIKESNIIITPQKRPIFIDYTEMHTDPLRDLEWIIAHYLHGIGENVAIYGYIEGLEMDIHDKKFASIHELLVGMVNARKRIAWDAFSASPVEQKALADSITGIWNYIKGDIMEKDPHVASKTAPFLSRLYHALERTFAEIKRKEIDKTIYPFAGLKTREYSQEQQLFTPETINREIRVGFLPMAVNPLNWGHILIAFMAINALSLDMVIFRGQGEIKYKDLPESDRVPMRDRHEVLQEVVLRLMPLIRYTDIGTAPNDEKEGFEHMYQLLELNPQQKIHTFYLIGIENKERVVKYSRQQYELSGKYKLHHNHRVTVGWIQRGEYGAVVTREEMDGLYRETQEKTGVSERLSIALIKDPDIDLNVSSTYYRNTHDAAIIPGIVDAHARAHGYYGHPPIDPRTGKPYDISEEEQFKVKLRPIAEGIANRIVRQMERMDSKAVGIVGIDGPSGSGKTTLAKEAAKYAALRGYEYCIIGTDIFLKAKEWRGAIEKLVVGEPLTDKDKELLGTFKDSISQGTFYGEEIFWDNEDIVRVLREVDAFRASDETAHTVGVKNGYNRDTKIRQDYSFLLKRKMIIIFEGKFTFRDEFMRYFDLTYRVHDNPDRTKAKFEMRTRKLSPNTADRQMKFYEAGMVPSYGQYAKKTQKALHYLADIATDDWRLAPLREEKDSDEASSSAAISVESNFDQFIQLVKRAEGELGDAKLDSALKLFYRALSQYYEDLSLGAKPGNEVEDLFKEVEDIIKDITAGKYEVDVMFPNSIPRPEKSAAGW